MWQCPVCMRRHEKETVCSQCGFDVYRDFVHQRTVSAVSVADYQSMTVLAFERLLAEKVALENENAQLKKQLNMQKTRVFQKPEIPDSQEKETDSVSARKAEEIYSQVYREIYRNERLKKTLKQKMIEMMSSHQYAKEQKEVIYPNGRYTGMTANGKREGYGIMMYDNGTIYTGQWQDDHKTGYGEEKHDNVYLYEGTFVNDNWQGYGVCHYSGGECYRGNWEKGRQKGFGEVVYSKDSRYTGEFFNINSHGYGVYCDMDKKISGLWQNGWYIKGEIKCGSVQYV